MLLFPHGCVFSLATSYFIIAPLSGCVGFVFPRVFKGDFHYFCSTLLSLHVCAPSRLYLCFSYKSAVSMAYEHVVYFLSPPSGLFKVISACVFFCTCKVSILFAVSFISHFLDLSVSVFSRLSPAPIFSAFHHMCMIL